MVKYIEKIQYAGEEPQYVKGDFFRGKWDFKESLPLITAQTFKPGDYFDYDLSKYLPDDGHDYEVMFSMRTHTGTTANNQCHWWVRSGSKDNYWLQARVTGVRTNTANHEIASATCIIPIKATDKYIGFFLATGSHNTGGTWCTIHGFRKINNNTEDDIEKTLLQSLVFDNNGDKERYILGGDITAGKWKAKNEVVLTEVAIPKKYEYNVNLSPFLPEDENDYECIIDGTVATSATSGEYTILFLGIEDENNNKANIEVASLYVRSGANKYNYFNIHVPIYYKNRTINIFNDGTSNISLNLRLEGYRRMGYYG